MEEKYLLSTAYFPPVPYMTLVARSGEVFIEKEENYHKQTFRNRCSILTATGLLSLSVPVFLGSLHKTALKDIRIDYSKRWQQVHWRALVSSYQSAPYFLFYSEQIRKVIDTNHVFLIDLNMSSLQTALDIVGLNTNI